MTTAPKVAKLEKEEDRITMSQTPTEQPRDLELELTKSKLKNQALVERITTLSEDNADYRVDITLLASRVQELEAEVAALRDNQTQGEEPVVVEGVVADDAD